MAAGQPLIDAYKFGRLVVGGRAYERDVIITPSGVVPNWWRLEGHRLQLEDVEKYLGLDVDAVVVGTGYHGFMRVDSEVVESFRRMGREVYVLETGRAVEKYNELVARGRRVLAMLHLTC